LLLLAVAFCGFGCSSRRAPVPEDSLTSGRISVVCAPEARTLLERERETFAKLYPQADIRMVDGGSREAVRALFAAQADLAAITRDLEPEERAAAVRGRLELEGYHFARDAVVVVVHAGNPVENLALDDLRRIYESKVSNWSRLGGRDQPIVPVLQPPTADISEFFVQSVMSGEPITAPVASVASDSAVVAYVRDHENAIGFVSMAWSARAPRTLRVAKLTGLPYVEPDPETVYRGEYPLTRYLNLYVRPDGPRLANGFITFVTSRDGQALVHEAGLVPTSVPVRFVRRSPMQSSH